MDRIVSAESLPDSIERLLGSTADGTVAVVSSRLGRNPILRRHVCRCLTRSLLDCRSRRSCMLVAMGSAIEPWAMRGAELMGVPAIRIAVGEDSQCADLVVIEEARPPLSRDAVVIEAADRVDAMFVRRGGSIEKILKRRLASRLDATTRVNVTPVAQCAALRLIESGAIGWFCTDHRPPSRIGAAIEGNQVTTDSTWIATAGEWLVHCTRAPRGAWPDETVRQYQDSLLIGDDQSGPRTPLAALARIIRSGKLLAAATATSKKYPVVCFSELSLAELLSRRTFRPQLGRWDYEPYGIAIRRAAAASLEVRPVIYGQPGMRDTLAADQRYRFHPIGNTFDWRAEREWRSAGTIDLHAFDRADVRVFAADSIEARHVLGNCPWPVAFIPIQSDIGV